MKFSIKGHCGHWSIALLMACVMTGLFPTPGIAQVVQPDSIMFKAEQLARQLFYRNHDTAYISNYSDKAAVRLIGINKYNFFRLIDNNQGVNLSYRPDSRINLGLGVSYKWFSLDLAFNFGILEDEKFKESNFFDFQGTVFSSKHFLGIGYQYYFGFELANGSGDEVAIPEISEVRNDARTVHFSLNYLYVFNYGKFSLKAPFVLNEVQRKSAGSFVAGASFFISLMNADSTLIPGALQDKVDDILLLTDLNVAGAALTGGYMYSFVWKEHFYLTLGIIPGLNFVAGDYQTGTREVFGLSLLPKFHSMNALGYNSHKFFVALQYSTDTDYVKFKKKIRVDFGRGKLKLSVGYRFGGKSA